MSGNLPVLARRGLRLAVLMAAGVCVLAIAAGAFAFSYPGVRDTALTAGVSPRVARFYPLLFDAVLIVACAAAITLRGALRGYAWLAILVIIGAVATADTAHAMSITVPRRSLEATIAIAPWVVLLGGLTLLDAMIRQKARGPRAAAAAPVSADGRATAAASPDPAAGQPADANVVPLSALLHDRPTTPATRAKAPARQPAADASQAKATTGPVAAGPGQPQATASPPKTTTGPVAASPGQPQATASPPKTTTGPVAASSGQPTAPGGPPKTTTGTVTGDPGQPTVAGSSAMVSQTPPEPREGRSREG